MRSGCDTTTPCAHLSICAKKTKFASGRPQTPANRDCALLMRCSWRSSQADIAFQCGRCARQRRREPSARNNTMDTLGFEPRAFRMQSGCDTATPCAHILSNSRIPSGETPRDGHGADHKSFRASRSSFTGIFYPEWTRIGSLQKRTRQLSAIVFHSCA